MFSGLCEGGKIHEVVVDAPAVLRLILYLCDSLI